MKIYSYTAAIMQNDASVVSVVSAETVVSACTQVQPIDRPKIVRQWIITQLIRYNFRTYVDNNGLSVCWDLLPNDNPLTRLAVSIETTKYTITCEIQPTSSYPLLFTVNLKNGGKKRITYQTFRASLMEVKIPSDDRPYCSICEQKLCVYLGASGPTYRTVIDDRSGRGTLDTFERGHELHHQKIAREVNNLYKIILPLIKIMSDGMTPARPRIYGISKYLYQPGLQDRINSINIFAPNWYSRLIFQCIWTFRRGETILAHVPREIFLMISSMIYSPSVLRRLPAR